jgi:hypothetical protein
MQFKTGRIILMILGLGILGFGLFGLANVDRIVNVGGLNFNFHNSFWQLLAVVAAGGILCFWGFYPLFKKKAQSTPPP